MRWAQPILRLSRRACARANDGLASVNAGQPLMKNLSHFVKSVLLWVYDQYKYVNSFSTERINNIYYGHCLSHSTPLIWRHKLTGRRSDQLWVSHKKSTKKETYSFQAVRFSIFRPLCKIILDRSCRSARKWIKTLGELKAYIICCKNRNLDMGTLVLYIYMFKLLWNNVKVVSH